MKRIIALVLSVISLFCLTITFTGCNKEADDFTEAEHIQRITERIEKTDLTWGFPEGEERESFVVYPLYEKNEELKYAIVEFEPYGFLFIKIRDEQLAWLSACTGGNTGMLSTSMYGLGSWYDKEYTWSPYIKDITYSQPYPDPDKIWILDDNDQRIFYDKSPYFVTGNLNEKKYFIEVNNSAEFICAVKKDGEFVNLISGKTVDFNSLRAESTISSPFIGKGPFDLD